MVGGESPRRETTRIIRSCMSRAWMLLAAPTTGRTPIKLSDPPKAQGSGATLVLVTTQNRIQAQRKNNRIITKSKEEEEGQFWGKAKELNRIWSVRARGGDRKTLQGCIAYPSVDGLGWAKLVDSSLFLPLTDTGCTVQAPTWGLGCRGGGVRSGPG
ncbi:hypothetical protein CI102_813 [Trichoderma harzianum]|uniref:Uncharacterized protein n=1 Tax=Trichoderma harzianum CBS 226.95 TaxID=983964 RepID=A0A2T3ZYY6_TRIHA|nr:hypothetical protein M431DRAFT_259007 [Trichoderma harzianum CBS 226.95]PKK54515.1 hypothetical protein CI102_813 [Trichoderma harzianum]PTB50022.1 hypothetical protein M431DRAFT_259007 [Trichoderma harzianum CBS 226.95]